MIRLLVAMTITCLAVPSGARAAGRRGPAESVRPEDLLEAHLGQVRALRAASGAASPSPVIDEVRAAVRERARLWTRTVDDGARGAGGLLRGLDAQDLSEAARLADVRAGGSLARSPRVGAVLALVAQRNPDAATAWQEWRAILRQFEQASFLEDTISQFRAFVREVDTKVGPQTHREMPEKTFAFPSAMALRGQLVDIAADLGGLKHRQTLRKALDDAGRSYYQIRYASRAIRLTTENRELFADMEALTRAQLQVGKVSQADSLKAQSTLAALDTQIATLELDRSAEVARANALMALPPDAAWGEPVSGDLQDADRPLEALLTRALSDNQDLAIARREVDQMDTMVRMAETMVFPRASAGASLIAPSVGAEAGPTRSAMATFPSVPSPGAERAGLGANAAYIDELRVRAVRARRARDAMRVKVAQMVQDAHARAAIARRTLGTYAHDIAPRARQAFLTMRERYNTSQAPFIEYLDAGRTHLDTTLKVEEARRDLARALLDLADALGSGPGELLPAEPRSGGRER